MANDLNGDGPTLADVTPKDVTPGWMRSRTCRTLRVRLDHYDGPTPTRWLLSRRIAGQIVEELRPYLTGPEQQMARVEDLTGLFGLPVELVADLSQGAILR